MDYHLTASFILLGGIVSADAEAAWQFMLSQPLVAASLAGALLGNFTLGWTVGLLLQLPFMVEFPVGGKALSAAGAGSYIAAGIAIWLRSAFQELPETALFLSLVAGILFSWVGMKMRPLQHRVNLWLVSRGDDALAQSKPNRITSLQYAGLLWAIALGAAFTAAGSYVGGITIAGLMSQIGNSLEPVLSLIKPSILGAGLGAMMILFLRRQLVWSLALGCVAGTVTWIVLV